MKVGLTPLSIFKGGSEKSNRGARFNPNVPTEEVYSSPDWRKTNGFVRATRPVDVRGTLIDGLTLTFKDGEVTSFTAERGEDVFRAYLQTDDGARRLGEVALVGIDSPIFQSGILFFNTLFDENAACHIALGKAYADCVQGGTTMSLDELATLGMNSSDVHDDFMISSPDVDVHAIKGDGTSVPLLLKGSWVDGL